MGWADFLDDATSAANTAAGYATQAAAPAAPAKPSGASSSSSSSSSSSDDAAPAAASSSIPTPYLVVGGVAVAGLLAFALTRKKVRRNPARRARAAEEL